MHPLTRTVAVPPDPCLAVAFRYSLDRDALGNGTGLGLADPSGCAVVPFDCIGVRLLLVKQSREKATSSPSDGNERNWKDIVPPALVWLRYGVIIARQIRMPQLDADNKGVLKARSPLLQPLEDRV